MKRTVLISKVTSIPNSVIKLCVRFAISNCIESPLLATEFETTEKFRNLEIVGKPALGGKTHYSLPEKGISSSVKSVCGKEFHGLD